MSISLSPLPPDDHRAFDALLAELPEEQAAVLRSASGTLAPLLGSAPYLLDLTRKHAAWLAKTLEDDADDALNSLLAMVRETGRHADEGEVVRTLRIAKGRTALLAAIAETGDAWTTARATEALSDLADAALEAALDFLMRQAFAAGRLAIPESEAPAANSGLALFALGKHGGRELNYSSDIDIVAFFDPERVYQAHKGGRDFDELHVAMRRGDYQPTATPDLGLPV